MLNSNLPTGAVWLGAHGAQLARVDQCMLDAMFSQYGSDSIGGETLGDPVERHCHPWPTETDLSFIDRQ